MRGNLMCTIRRNLRRTSLLKKELSQAIRKSGAMPHFTIFFIYFDTNNRLLFNSHETARILLYSTLECCLPVKLPYRSTLRVASFLILFSRNISQGRLSFSPP